MRLRITLAAHMFRSFFRVCHQLVTLFVCCQNDPAHSQAWSNLNYGEKYFRNYLLRLLSNFRGLRVTISYQTCLDMHSVRRSFLGNDETQFPTEAS